MREKLLEKIELLRQQMIHVGLELGLDHPDVLSYSQEIDRLHNQLLELDCKQRKSGKRPYYRFYISEEQANFA
ncbi:aspartyl-phosphate phosphatase Spo0E family protein [Brevibacillus humidisoli]|uniref:aspartyl-phosphate phosphatase Spo0E family protein n=1 Tax=Brevibacillus humidisoli TaxID=2895522 RepID=UPI001E3588BA|nr:aspartyl-phosphate phosphatase Spo0E family protein [Brevibacillus humidisoli]UFJ39663.1 aspartyl-phosphate phosphatase Spo0E family protein [Brevibacillus humidisoli]